MVVVGVTAAGGVSWSPSPGAGEGARRGRGARGPSPPPRRGQVSGPRAAGNLRAEGTLSRGRRGSPPAPALPRPPPVWGSALGPPRAAGRAAVSCGRGRRHRHLPGGGGSLRPRRAAAGGGGLRSPAPGPLRRRGQRRRGPGPAAGLGLACPRRGAGGRGLRGLPPSRPPPLHRCAPAAAPPAPCGSRFGRLHLDG